MPENQLALPTTSIWTLHQLQKAGFEAYLVGGAVRDVIRHAKLGETDNNWLTEIDFDITTNAKPEQIQAIFPNSFYENKFGTVSITMDEVAQQANITLPKPDITADKRPKVVDLTQASKIHSSLVDSQSNNHATNITQQSYKWPNIEITTYRSQELYENDHRHPSSMQWGATLEEDLQRRDFTINAMAIAINPDVVEKIIAQARQNWLINVAANDWQLIDNYHGLPDLANEQIRTVGHPHQRFSEDALRLLRAIRFSVQLGFSIEDQTKLAICELHNLLPHISGERIRDEFLKMLASPYPKQAIELLDETDTLQYILPELLAAKGVKQGGHHTTDVWTHSLDALANCPSSDPIVRLATLLHDIGKPSTFQYQAGQITFYNHEVVGAHMAKKIGRNLRLSKAQIDKLFILIRYHMFYYQPENTDAAIRRFMRQVGLNYIDDILDLREADRLGSGARKTSWRLEEMKTRIKDQLHQPLDVSDLAVDGHQIMAALGIKPGPILGKILNELFEDVLQQPEINQPDTLLKKAAEIYKQSLQN